MEITTFILAGLVGLAVVASVIATVREVSRDAYHRIPDRLAR